MRHGDRRENVQAQSPGKKNSLNAELAEGGGPPRRILPRFYGDRDALGRRGNTVQGRGGRGTGWVFTSLGSFLTLPQAGIQDQEWGGGSALLSPSEECPGDAICHFFIPGN